MGMPCEGNVTEVKCKWVVEHLGHGTHRIQFPNQIASLSYTTRSCKVYCNPQKKKKENQTRDRRLYPYVGYVVFIPRHSFALVAGPEIEFNILNCDV